MARIFTEGFELGNPYVFDEQDNLVLLGGRSGVYSLEPRGYARKYVGDVTEIYVRFAVLSKFLSVNTWFQIFNDTGQVIAWLRWARDAPISAYVQGQLVGTTTRRLNAQPHWYLVELRYKYNSAPATADGVFQVKVENVLEIDASGLITNPYETDYLGKVGWVGSTNNNLYDDIAINTADTGADGGWPGDGRIVPVRPNGNGDSSDFDGSDGNSIDNYLLVDEAQMDFNTTYVESEVSGDVDLYQVQDLSLFNGDAIQRVWVAANARETSADGDTMQLGLKPNGASSPTWTTTEPLTENYEQHTSAEHKVNPHTSSAWSENDINSLQIGVKVP